MSSIPSLLRSAVRGEDREPIIGRSLFQTTSLRFFAEVSEQAENNPANINAIPIEEKNLIFTKEVLRKIIAATCYLSFYFFTCSETVPPLFLFARLSGLHPITNFPI